MTQTTTQRNKIALLVILVIAILLVLLAVLAVMLIPVFTSLPSANIPEPETPTLPPPEASPYGPEDFQLDENGYMTCLAGRAVMGIDVSAYQGKIDWKQVKDAGVRFVFIRVGGRGWGEAGTLYSDALAQDNYLGARKAGLRVGAYFFSQATSVFEAIQEAFYVLYLTSGWKLDLPIVYDWEWVSDEARTAHVDRATLMDCTVAFCEVIRSAGHTPMIYFNRSQSENLLHMELLKDYPWWLAMYADTFIYPYKVDYWQYSCTGKVPGISTDVDLNVWFPDP